MTRSISSAQPWMLYRYANIGSYINHELISESHHLAHVLQHFEATCTEYRIHVSYLAHDLRGYAQRADHIDRWVRNVGKGFEKADRRALLDRILDLIEKWRKGKKLWETWQPLFAGTIIASSIRAGSAYEGEIIINLPDFLRKFGFSLREIRKWAGLSPYLNHIKYTNLPTHFAKVGLITSIPIIAYKWFQDVKEWKEEQYSKSRLASAMTVDAGLTLGTTVAATWAGAKVGALIGAGIGSIVPGVGTAVGGAVGAIIGGVVGGVAAAWAVNKYGVREKSITWLDEHVFAPIAKTIAQGVDTVHNWVDVAARRLRQKFEEAKEAASRVIFDRAIRPTDGPALEVRNALHDAMDGWGTDEQKIFDILENASDEEKKAVLHDQALMSRLERELGRKDMLKVLALLGAPIKMQLERAMAGFGTDEDAIYDILKHASNEEIISVRSDAALMEALKKELTDKELIIVLKLLYPGQPIPDIEDVRKNNVSLEVMESKLFVRGVGDNADISDNDVAQGMLGDCYLVAAMGEIAHQNPERIRQMIHDNGDGTYDVILFDEVQKKFVTVTVDNMFPTHGGRPFYVQGGDQRELWPMIIEKAYAKYFGNENYGNIEGGWPSIAMERLTGGKTTVYNGGSVSNFPLSIEDFGAHFSAGDAIAVGNVGGKVNHPDIVSKHAYYVVGVNVDNKTVTVQNPWGRKYPPITMSWEQFVQTFEKISITDLSGAQISIPSP